MGVWKEYKKAKRAHDRAKKAHMRAKKRLAIMKRKRYSWQAP